MFTDRRSLFACGVLALTVALLLAATQAAQAQTFTVLHEFAGFPNDGRMPTASLIEDSAGNLYGTTYAAGKFGGGIVFKLNPSGHETVLHNFSTGTAAAATNGANPAGGLVRDAAGNLYGTTTFGGDLSCDVGYGCGTVFRLDPTNRLTVFQRFHWTNGNLPQATLVLDGENLYGSTGLGGGSNRGTLFTVNTSTGHLTVLHSFPPSFGDPSGAIAVDATGNVFGTTSFDGESECGCGTIFEMNSIPRGLGIMDEFGGTSGAVPVGGVVMDAAGDLYGTTSQGGNGACAGAAGCGVVFKFDSLLGQTALYTFTGLADGANPQAGVIRDAAGNLYGTTRYGGMTTTAGGRYGVVFKIDTTGAYTVLHRFDGSDGAQPEANLLLDSAGNLYGTTAFGGSSACKGGCGVVFKIAP